MGESWSKPKPQGGGFVSHHPSNGTLVSGNTTMDIRQKAFKQLSKALPADIAAYSKSCVQEHEDAVSSILNLGYEADDLFFRDYLSGPRNVIQWNETEALMEAFKDARYELVPVVRFSNPKSKNPEDDVSETSAIYVEFHQRGMAF